MWQKTVSYVKLQIFMFRVNDIKEYVETLCYQELLVRLFQVKDLGSADDGNCRHSHAILRFVLKHHLFKNMSKVTKWI